MKSGDHNSYSPQRWPSLHPQHTSCHYVTLDLNVACYHDNIPQGHAHGCVPCAASCYWCPVPSRRPLQMCRQSGRSPSWHPLSDLSAALTLGSGPDLDLQLDLQSEGRSPGAGVGLTQWKVWNHLLGGHKVTADINVTVWPKTNFVSGSHFWPRPCSSSGFYIPTLNNCHLTNVSKSGPCNRKPQIVLFQKHLLMRCSVRGSHAPFRQKFKAFKGLSRLEMWFVKAQKCLKSWHLSLLLVVDKVNVRVNQLVPCSMLWPLRPRGPDY